VFQKLNIIVSEIEIKNLSFVFHHAFPYQLHFEEDILESRNDIINSTEFAECMFIRFWFNLIWKREGLTKYSRG